MPGTRQVFSPLGIIVRQVEDAQIPAGGTRHASFKASLHEPSKTTLQPPLNLTGSGGGWGMGTTAFHGVECRDRRSFISQPLLIGYGEDHVHCRS